MIFNNIWSIIWVCVWLLLLWVHIISRNTLGYRKRYAYIEENKFNLSHNKKWREIKKLKDLGLLENTKTRGYTMFKLILPEWLDNAIQWRGSEDKKG